MILAIEEGEDIVHVSCEENVCQGINKQWVIFLRLVTMWLAYNHMVLQERILRHTLEIADIAKREKNSVGQSSEKLVYLRHQLMHHQLVPNNTT